MLSLRTKRACDRPDRSQRSQPQRDAVEINHTVTGDWPKTTCASGVGEITADRRLAAVRLGYPYGDVFRFLVQGDKQNAAQLANLKGQMDAIEQASIQKNCGIQFRPAQPPASVAAPAANMPPAASYADQK